MIKILLNTFISLQLISYNVLVYTSDSTENESIAFDIFFDDAACQTPPDLQPASRLTIIIRKIGISLFLKILDLKERAHLFFKQLLSKKT